MSIEPIASFGVAKAVLGTGTAAIHLTDTVLSRLKAGRSIRAAEQSALKVMLDARVRHLHQQEQIYLSDETIDRIVHLTEKMFAAIDRAPQAEAALYRQTATTIDSIMKTSILPDVSRY